MNGAFYIGATGLRAQERALDAVANNVANINTPGFKRSEVTFLELVSEPAERPDLSPEVPDAVGAMSGVMGSANRVFEQGDIRSTGKALDLAISGDGFIELMAPGGQVALWRGGTLKVSDDGYLAASNGMPLKALIQVPEGATGLTISLDGKVRAALADGQKSADLGQIELVRPDTPTDLTSVGEGLYRPNTADRMTAASPGEDGMGTLMQGALEGSNVKLAEEMVTLLLLQRAYGANAQMVQAGDQLMTIANNLRR